MLHSFLTANLEYVSCLRSLPPNFSYQHPWIIIALFLLYPPLDTVP